jgi:hypothetical protein
MNYPGGDLSNSDLELGAGIAAHQDILAQSVDARERTFTLLNDNSPAVSRASKGSRLPPCPPDQSSPTPPLLLPLLCTYCRRGQEECHGR